MGETTESQLRQEWRNEVKREIHKLEAKFETLHNDQTKVLTKLARIEVMLSGELKIQPQPAHMPTPRHRLEAGGFALGAVTLAEGIKFIAQLFK